MDIEDTIYASIGTPRCAMCEMPVESLEIKVIGEAVVFTVHCHGDIESTTLTLEEFSQIRELEFGLAFADSVYQPDPQGSFL